MLDSQSHSAPDECHLIIKAFGIFLFTSLAKRQPCVRAAGSARGIIPAFPTPHERSSPARPETTAPAAGEQAPAKTGGIPVLLMIRGTDHLVIIDLAHHRVVLRCCRLTFRYPILNEGTGGREAKSLCMGRRALRAIRSGRTVLPRASVGKELFSLMEYMVSVSSEHPLLSSPKPPTNDITSN